MTYTIDTATKFHERQVAAVSAVQSLLVKAVETLSGLTTQAPKAPEKLTSKLDEVAGTVDQARRHPERGAGVRGGQFRDWLEVQHKFQTALLDAVTSYVRRDRRGAGRGEEATAKES